MTLQNHSLFDSTDLVQADIKTELMSLPPGRFDDVAGNICRLYNTLKLVDMVRRDVESKDTK